jgi:hypothetical protein
VKLIAGWVAGGIAFLVILAAIGGGDSPATVSATPGTTVTVPGPTTTVTVPGAAVTVQRTVRQTVPGPTATVTQAPLPARTVTVPAPRTTSRTTAPVPLARGTQTTEPPETTEALEANVYYANCAAVRAAGKAPLRRGEPGYASHLDRDDDGVACE